MRPRSNELNDELWLLTHPDIRKSGRIYAFMAHCVEAIRKRRDLIEGLWLLTTEASPRVSVMPHMIFRSPFYYLSRSVMNTGDGSSRMAFQLDPLDLKGCKDAFGALVSEGANSILVEPAPFVLNLVQRLSEVATYWLLLRFGRV